MGISAFPQGSLERERPPGGGGECRAQAAAHSPPLRGTPGGPERGGRSLHILPACAARRLPDKRALAARRDAHRESAVSLPMQFRRGFPDKDRTTAGRAPPSENAGLSEFS